MGKDIFEGQIGNEGVAVTGDASTVCVAFYWRYHLPNKADRKVVKPDALLKIQAPELPVFRTWLSRVLELASMCMAGQFTDAIDQAADCAADAEKFSKGDANIRASLVSIIKSRELLDLVEIVRLSRALPLALAATTDERRS